MTCKHKIPILNLGWDIFLFFPFFLLPGCKKCQEFRNIWQITYKGKLLVYITVNLNYSYGKDFCKFLFFNFSNLAWSLYQMLFQLWFVIMYDTSQVNYCSLILSMVFQNIILDFFLTFLESEDRNKTTESNLGAIFFYKK